MPSPLLSYVHFRCFPAVETGNFVFIVSIRQLDAKQKNTIENRWQIWNVAIRKRPISNRAQLKTELIKESPNVLDRCPSVCHRSYKIMATLLNINNVHFEMCIKIPFRFP